jgi:hypothetical protein
LDAHREDQDQLIEDEDRRVEARRREEQGRIDARHDCDEQGGRTSAEGRKSRLPPAQAPGHRENRRQPGQRNEPDGAHRDELAD